MTIIIQIISWEFCFADLSIASFYDNLKVMSDSIRLDLEEPLQSLFLADVYITVKNRWIGHYS